MDARNWQFLDKVQGQGFSVVPTQYIFQDEDPFDGISYYRLKQVDYNDDSEYSSIISLTYYANKRVSIFPNPVESILSWKMNDGNRLPQGKFHIHVFTTTGHFLFDKETDSNQIDVSHLQKGLYIIRIKNAFQQEVYRFMKE